MESNVAGIKTTLVELIVNISSRIDDIVNEYNSSGIFDSNRLYNLFDDLQALAEGADAIKEFYRDIDLLELREKLDMIERAMESQDKLLLADLLEYELRDMLAFWERILSN